MFFTKVCIWLYSGIISTGVFPLEEEILLCPVWKLERAGWCFWGCVEKRVGWDWLMAVFLNPDLALPSWMSLTTNQVFQPWGQAGGQRKAGTLTALSSSLGLCPQPGVSTVHEPHWSLAPSFLFLPFTCIKSLFVGAGFHCTGWEKDYVCSYGGGAFTAAPSGGHCQNAVWKAPGQLLAEGCQDGLDQFCGFFSKAFENSLTLPGLDGRGSSRAVMLAMKENRRS